MTTHTEPRDTSAVGRNPHPRNFIGTAMRVLTTVTGSEFAEKYNIREPINRIAYQGTKTGFQTLGAANRAFKAAQGGGSGQAKRLTSAPKDYFNLTPDDEQQMIAETVKEFATELLRPAAHDADAAAAAPEELVARSAELGITMINVPEEFDGAASERGVVTNALVAEAMAYGDMGLALPLLAPSGVATTLTNFGTDEQQRTYLPDFAGENVPQSAVVIAEPRPPLRRVRVEHQGNSRTKRIPAERRQVVRPGRRIVGTVPRRRAARRQARAVHRRVRHQGTHRRGRSRDGRAGGGYGSSAAAGRRRPRIRHRRR